MSREKRKKKIVMVGSLWVLVIEDCGRRWSLAGEVPSYVQVG